MKLLKLISWKIFGTKSVNFCLAIILIGVVTSCGTRKSANSSHVFKSDSIIVDNSVVLSQNTRFNNIVSLKPINPLKPIIFDGKEYFNASIVFDNSEIKDFQIEQKNLSVDVSKKKVEKIKEIQKSDTANLWLGIAFVIGLVIYFLIRKSIFRN